MDVFYGIEKLPRFEHPVLTIGTFDGVHHGHKKILQSVVAEAKAMNGTSVLLTFDPHPRKLIFPNEPLKLLCTLQERLAHVAESGIDVTVVVPFTQSFASLSAQNYIEDFLLKLFRPSAIIIGYDHHFGQDRTGDIAMLKAYSNQHNFIVKEIPAQLISEAAVSSTQVRKALVSGDVKAAKNMLGEAYCISGIVTKGAQRGRTIGYPTANINLADPDKLIPKIGVYAVNVFIDGTTWKGMLNLGINPTVSTDNSIKIEVHIFDFDQDIYDGEITVAFIDRIREEQKFDGLDALKNQLAQDKQQALALL